MQQHLYRFISSSWIFNFLFIVVFYSSTSNLLRFFRLPNQGKKMNNVFRRSILDECGKTQDGVSLMLSQRMALHFGFKTP